MGENELCWGGALGGVREQGHSVTTLVPGTIWLAAAPHRAPEGEVRVCGHPG